MQLYGVTTRVQSVSMQHVVQAAFKLQNHCAALDSATCSRPSKFSQHNMTYTSNNWLTHKLVTQKAIPNWLRSTGQSVHFSVAENATQTILTDIGLVLDGTQHQLGSRHSWLRP